MCGACAGKRRKFNSIGVGVTGAPRRWPVSRHGCAGRVRGSAAISTRSARASPARLVRGPFRPRMCGASAGERRNFDSIGVGVTGTPRLWSFNETDVQGMSGGAPQFRLDRGGHHRHAASVARFRRGCAERARGSAASSTQSGWTLPASRVGGPFRPRMCGACAGTGASRLTPRRNFTSHRRCAESGNNIPSKGRRGRGVDPTSLPVLVLL